jgi:FkbH-like protein
MDEETQSLNLHPRFVKCLIWDLDNTVWDGTLLEDKDVRLRDEVVNVITTLDARGILHSVASRNDFDTAMAKLSEFGLEDYFLHPQIHWHPKSRSVRFVADALNIGTDTLAFVDDDPFERDEVTAALPEVFCIDAVDAIRIPDMPNMQPPSVTEDSSHRRATYQAELRRQDAAKEMAPEEFLRSLQMAFTISEASETDLARVEELTERTTQLNSTGITYSRAKLSELRESTDHMLLVAGLEDVYGSYGKIGIAVVEKSETKWHLRLFLMSCRVMSRGVGKVLLSYILQQAKLEGKHVAADFIRTPRNRPMYLTFKLAGFEEKERRGDVARLEHDLSIIDPIPDYVGLRVGD